jgi:hypothetical protein
MKRCKRLCIPVVASIILIISLGLFAGPTIIRDNRITDTATTPLLGRGYSVGVNTFQSSCMKKVVITEPSYDFTYTFDSLESSRRITTSREGDVERKVGEKTETGTRKVRNWNWGQWSGSAEYRDIVKTTISKIGKETVINNEKWYSHIILANIDLYSYYASVDEANSELSDSAAELLRGNDIPGFFNSCGPYYVRSIGRKATFKSVFEYKTRTRERDVEFEGKLETQIKGFQSYVASYKYRGREYYRSEQAPQLTSSEKKSLELQEKFSEEASSKHLTITTMAFGLGKDKKATLISYDIDTFKNAIKDAFMSMQNPRTGKVSSIEVIPWVENTQFQTLIGLEKSEDEYEVLKDDKGNVIMDSLGNPRKKLKPKLTLYEKKHFLTTNAEFLMEIERVDRNLMNMYYKAKLCRKNIDMQWKSGGKLKKEYAGSLVQNNREPDETMSLSDLDKKLTPETINGIYALERKFMYGEDLNKQGGASACIRKIMEEGIFKKSYRDIAECQDIIEKMGEVQDEVIEYYCLPMLAD